MTEHPDKKQVEKLRIRDIGALFKRFFILTFLSFIVILAISQTSQYINMRTILYGELDEANTRSLSKVQTVMDMIRQSAVDTMRYLEVDTNITSFLSHADYRKTSYLHINTQLEIMQQMVSWQRVSAFESMMIYSSESDSVLSTDYGGCRLEYYPDRDVIELAKTLDINPGQVAYVLRERTPLVFSKPYKSLTIIKRIKVSGAKAKDGYFIVNAKPEQLGALMVNTRMDDTSDILMLNPHGEVYLDSSLSMLGHHIDELCGDGSLSETFLQNVSGTTNARINGRLMRVFWLRSTLDGMCYVQMLPYSVYMTMFQNLVSTTLLILVVGIVLSLLIAYMLSMYVHRPIRLIRRTINHLSVSTDEVHDEETRYILMKLMLSHDKTASLEEENLRQFEILKRTQANVLQAQITPHFLYNTLQSIHMMILMETQNASSPAAEAVLALSSITRSLIRRGIDTLPLKEELEHLRQYIYLQKLSYEERLKVDIDVAERLVNYTVPKLCLQPLLENSIRYGMRDNSVCYVRICVREDAVSLLITIDDNGNGMDDAQIDALNQLARETIVFRDQHVGIINLAQRLQLLFGDAAHLNISRSELGGLCVNFTLPKLLG